MCQEFGIENDAIPDIAFFFGGGIANTGLVCGAISGAMMSLGLVMGRPPTEEDVPEWLAVGQSVRRRFEEKMGSSNCRELTGADLGTEEGVQGFLSSDVPDKV